MTKIIIKRKGNKLNIVNTKQKVALKQTNRKISIRSSSKRGLPGTDGTDGVNGKSAYEIAVDHGFIGTEQDWVDSLPGTDGIDGDGDKNYVQSFNVSSDIVVPHNLEKYPAITIFDSSGDEIEGQVIHQDFNSLRVKFSAPFSGTITCN